MYRSVISVLLFVSVAGAQAQAQAQAQERVQRRARRQATELRDLKILVRDTLGNRLPEVVVSASYRGREGLIQAETDGAGDHFFRVTETDTLDMMVYDQIFEIAVDGTDSLLIVSRIDTRASGVNAINSIDPVMVSAMRRNRVNVGYSSLSPEEMSSWGKIVDMSKSHLYTDMETLLQSQLGAGVHIGGGFISLRGNITLRGTPPVLIVVNGVAFGTNFAEFNLTYKPSIIESVFLDKVGTMYGVRGAGGVLVVTTKGSR